MRVRRLDSGAAFREAARPLIEGAADGLLSGLVDRMRGPMPAAVHAAVVETASGAAVGAAIGTARWKLVVQVTSPEATELLVEDARDALPDLPAVLGVEETARAFAAAWCAATGARAEPRNAQRLLVLEGLREPPRGDGALRRAGPADASLLAGWADAFLREADLDDRTPGLHVVERRIVDGDLFVWDADGVRSMAAVVSRPPRGARIGLVYTPPGHRRQGHASRLVAALSQHLIQEGRPRVALFTQAANPGSNRLYERLGYRHRADCREIAFR